MRYVKNISVSLFCVNYPVWLKLATELFSQPEHVMQMFCICHMQVRIQNAKIITHITGETTGTSSDSHQSFPLSTLGLLLKERICFQREQILSFKNSLCGMEKRYFHIKGFHWKCTIFITHVRNCVMDAYVLSNIVEEFSQIRILGVIVYRSNIKFWPAEPCL